MCGVSDAEKFEMEAAALAQLKATLGDCMAAEEMEALWYEYEKGETEEAKLVKDFDKVRTGGREQRGGIFYYFFFRDIFSPFPPYLHPRLR